MTDIPMFYYKRNPLVIFMSIELMLNAVNLSFITYGNYLHYLDGQAAAFLLITVAAAEVAVGLAIIVALYRHRAEVDVDAACLMKG